MDSHIKKVRKECRWCEVAQTYRMMDIKPAAAPKKEAAKKKPTKKKPAVKQDAAE